MLKEWEKSPGETGCCTCLASGDGDGGERKC